MSKYTLAKTCALGVEVALPVVWLVRVFRLFQCMSLMEIPQAWIRPFHLHLVRLTPGLIYTRLRVYALGKNVALSMRVLPWWDEAFCANHREKLLTRLRIVALKAYQAWTVTVSYLESTNMDRSQAVHWLVGVEWLQLSRWVTTYSSMRVSSIFQTIEADRAVIEKRYTEARIAPKTNKMWKIYNFIQFGRIVW